jgi:uncharacterized lipoprotein YddW (UPF0748 family)
MGMLREATTRAGLASALTLLGWTAGGLHAQTAEPEVRGLWVVRTGLVSPSAVDAVVDQAAAGGINTLLVQVRGRGDAFYASRLAPRSVLLERQPQGFDPLARVIGRARARGLAVHAWFNVLLVSHFGQPLPAGHVLRERPEWAMVPRSMAAAALRARPETLLDVVRKGRDPDVEGYYLSPSIPAVVQHLDQLVRELVRAYPLDGLHLDFIRMPGPEYDNSRSALERFREASGGSWDLLSGPTLDPEGWSAHRRALVSALATRLARAAREERPGMQVSAAVVPEEAQAVNQRFQDWFSWASDGTLDAVCPMTYTPDERLFRAQIANARARLGPNPRLWAGVAAYRLSVDEMAARIHAARSLGASGVVLFSHESFSGDSLEALRGKAFAGALQPPGPAFGGGAAVVPTRR